MRSGVLTSVHAFATDPARGVFILAFLVAVVGGALALFAARAPALKGTALFAPISREGALILNNLLLTTACATVLLGTLYPLFLDALLGDKVSVGAPYFNATFGPLMVPLVAAMAIGPLLPWKRADVGAALARLKAVFAVTAAVVVAVLALAGGPALAVLGLGLAAWLVAAAAAELGARLRLFRAPPSESWRRARRLPRSVYGMSLAHGGFGLVIVGIVATTAWEEERLRIMRPGDTVALAGYEVELTGTSTIRGPNYSALRAAYEVRRDGRPIATMEPETRTYPDAADADLGGGDPADPGGRPVHRRRRARAVGRLGDAPVPQAAGPLDLVRHPGDGAGRHGFAERPPAPRRRAGAAAPCGRSARGGGGGVGGDALGLRGPGGAVRGDRRRPRRRPHPQPAHHPLGADRPAGAGLRPAARCRRASSAWPAPTSRRAR